MHDPNDTIAAIATAAGGAGRGIVRMSGPAVVSCLATCFQPDEPVPLDHVTSARSFLGQLDLAEVASPLPCNLLLWPTRRSYTRQVVAELHTLGSPPLVEALLETLCRCGARPAEPGEFSLRAFLAGRIDLTQAEAILGVIDAGGQRELDVALRQLAGSVAKPLVDLRNELLDLLADLEAGLDFADREIEFLSRQQLIGRLEALSSRLARLKEQFVGRSTIRTGIRVVLTGRPNAGKSSLFNALVGRDEALTSAMEGTTRDTVRAHCDLGGVGCELIDTAGLDLGGPRDEIARAVAEIARDELDEAHLRILCIDASQPLSRWDLDELDRTVPNDRQIVVWTKVDRARMAKDLSQNGTVHRSGSGSFFGRL
ncbi:MAG: tRNA modification GTPase, partial [Pirellulales bacterium]